MLRRLTLQHRELSTFKPMAGALNNRRTAMNPRSRGKRESFESLDSTKRASSSPAPAAENPIWLSSVNHVNKPTPGEAEEESSSSAFSEGGEEMKKKKSLPTITTSAKLITRIVSTGRTSRMTSQGRKSQMRALIIIGNGNGVGGFGVGKGDTVRDALLSAIKEGEKDMVAIDVSPWGSLYHDVVGKCNNTRVLIRSVPPSHFVSRAGPVVAAVCDVMGISSYTGKIIGRKNPYTVVNAAFRALGRHETPMEVARRRGRKIVDVNQPAGSSMGDMGFNDTPDGNEDLANEPDVDDFAEEEEENEAQVQGHQVKDVTGKQQPQTQRKDFTKRQESQ